MPARRPAACFVLALVALVASLLAGVTTAAPAAAEPSLRPAWAAGRVGELGNGRTSGSVNVDNTQCPWSGCVSGSSVEPVPVPVSDVYDFKAVAAAQYASIGLRYDGTVWGWGHDDVSGSTTSRPRPEPIEISDVTAIAAGGWNALALKSDGTIWAWGDNRSGELGNGTIDDLPHTTPTKVNTSGRFIAIAVNGQHAKALRDDGTVWAWGENAYGQAGQGSTRTTVYTMPVQVKNLSGIVSIATGFRHAFAVRNDGTLWGWGNNMDGALGDGTTEARYTPVHIAGVVGVAQVAAGDSNSVALDHGGRVWTWGNGFSGQSGIPGSSSSRIPRVVPSLANVKMISKNWGSTFAVVVDGSTWAWGDNSHGQLGVGDLSFCTTNGFGYGVRCRDIPTRIPGMNNPRTIAAGSTFMVASNGGSITPPPSLTGEPLTRWWREMLGSREGQALIADPVDTASGNFVHTETDLDGSFALEWERTYNSRNPATGTLGIGWSTSFSDTIALDEGSNAVLTQADGRAAVFTADGSGGFTSPQDERATLQRHVDGTWLLGWAHGDVWVFDSAGRLSSKRHWTGETATATRDTNGTLTRIDSSTGASLTMTYAADRLVEVVAGDGRRVSYAYGIDSALTAATTPKSGTTTYGIDAAGRVASVTDATGVLLVSNTYDADGRVLTQTTGAQGTTTSFTYEPERGLTRVDDSATGQSLTYTHDHAGRMRALFDAAGGTAANQYDAVTGRLTATLNRLGATSLQTFDAGGNVTTTTDANRIVRTAAYDADNRVTTLNDPAVGTRTFSYTGQNRVPTTITDAAGKTTTLEIADGLVTKETDADGVVTAFAYDAARRLTSRTVAPGTAAAATTTYTYDTAGHLLTETDSLDASTTYTYDGAGRVLSVTDPLGRATTYSYDTVGRLLTITDPLGKVTRNTYDASGRLATTVSPLGRITRLEYDSLGQLTRTALPGGTVDIEQQFGPLGRVTSSVDERNLSTSYKYDYDGNVTEVIDPTGAKNQATFDSGSRPVKAIDANGRTTAQVEYDVAGRVYVATEAGGLMTWYEYDAAGRVIKMTDPRGGVTISSYTAAGRLQTRTAPDGVTTTYTYDGVGRLWKETTPLGDTVHEYDRVGREVKTTSPGGLVTTRSYDAVGRVRTETDPAGVATTFSYTARDELSSVAKTGSGTISYAYDDDGNRTSVTDGNGRTTTFGYDDYGRMTSRTDATAKTTNWAYDAAGNITRESDPLGRATTYTYDAAGRVAKSTDGSGKSTTRTYDAAGQLTKLTYGDGSTVAYTYDAAGRRVTMVDATGTTTYAYEPDGRLAGMTRPDGRATSYAYDAVGRRTKAVFPDGTSYLYAYDTVGRLASITPGETMADTFTAPNGSAPDTAKWTRTTAGNATASVQGNGLSLSVPNTSGAAATLTATVAPTIDSELALRYRFGDTASTATFQAHLRSTSADGYSVEIANDSATVKLQKRQGGITSTIGTYQATVDTAWHELRFQAQGGMVRVRTWSTSEPEPSTWNLEVADTFVGGAGTAKLVFARVKGSHSAAVDGVVYRDLANASAPVASYAYDADSRVTSETLPDGARTFVWSGSRLTRLEQTVPGAPPVIALSYDAAGRVQTETAGASSMTYAYDDAGQLTGVTPLAGDATTYGYDAVGRRTRMTTGASTTTYSYDDAGQLTGSVTGSSTTSYSYDGAGRRTGSTTGSSSTAYAYDAAGRLSSYARGGTTQSRTYDGAGVLVAVSNTTGLTTTKTSLDWDTVGAVPALAAIAGASTTSVVGGLRPTAIRRGATSVALALDGRGSVLSTSTTASVARAASYDAYGVASDSPTFEAALGYRGEVTFDRLIHLRARDYDPSTGTFTAVDPLEGVAGTPTIANPYHYADNDPVNRYDPTGLRSGSSPFADLESERRAIEHLQSDLDWLQPYRRPTPTGSPTEADAPEWLQDHAKRQAKRTWSENRRTTGICLSGTIDVILSFELQGCLVDDGNVLGTATFRGKGVGLGVLPISGSAGVSLGYLGSNARSISGLAGGTLCVGLGVTVPFAVIGGVSVGADVCFGVHDGVTLRYALDELDLGRVFTGVTAITAGLGLSIGVSPVAGRVVYGDTDVSELWNYPWAVDVGCGGRLIGLPSPGHIGVCRL